jgi:hypothetical protein
MLRIAHSSKKSFIKNAAIKPIVRVYYVSRIVILKPAIPAPSPKPDLNNLLKNNHPLKTQHDEGEGRRRLKRRHKLHEPDSLRI